MQDSVFLTTSLEILSAEVGHTPVLVQTRATFVEQEVNRVESSGKRVETKSKEQGHRPSQAMDDRTARCHASRASVMFALSYRSKSARQRPGSP